MITYCMPADIPKFAEQKTLIIIVKEEEQHIREMQLIKKQSDNSLFSLQSKYEVTEGYRNLENS